MKIPTLKKMGKKNHIQTKKRSGEKPILLKKKKKTKQQQHIRTNKQNRGTLTTERVCQYLPYFNQTPTGKSYCSIPRR